MKNLVVLSNLKYHKIIMEEENRTEQARQDAPVGQFGHSTSMLGGKIWQIINYFYFVAPLRGHFIFRIL